MIKTNAIFFQENFNGEVLLKAKVCVRETLEYKFVIGKALL